MKTAALIMIVSVMAICYTVLYIIEKRNTEPHKLVLTAIMTAMSIAGRFVFAVIPGFKPVTAITVLAGMYVGAEAGFLCGSLTALISNFYFGQGPFTPFQMLCWGLTGVFAAILSKPLRRNIIWLTLYGIVAGVAYSLFMDIYTVIWSVSGWSLSFYLTAIGSAMVFTVEYAVSNVFFLWVLIRPLGRKIDHVMRKMDKIEKDSLLPDKRNVVQ